MKAWRIVADMEKCIGLWFEVAVRLREGRSGNDKKDSSMFNDVGGRKQPGRG